MHTHTHTPCVRGQRRDRCAAEWVRTAHTFAFVGLFPQQSQHRRLSSEREGPVAAVKERLLRLGPAPRRPNPVPLQEVADGVVGAGAENSGPADGRGSDANTSALKIKRRPRSPCSLAGPRPPPPCRLPPILRCRIGSPKVRPPRGFAFYITPRNPRNLFKRDHQTPSECPKQLIKEIARWRVWDSSTTEGAKSFENTHINRYPYTACAPGYTSLQRSLTVQ